MRRAVKPEERSLWHEAMRGVRRFVAAKPEEAIETSLGPVAAKPSGPVSKTRSPPLAPVRSVALPRFLDTETCRRLKHRTGKIEARLDLHGLTETAAHAALAGFIEDCAAANRHVVLIITGKGRLGRGILRRNLPLWLEAPGLRPHVAAIQPAFDHDGGDGALYVQMRRKSKLLRGY